MGYFCSKAILPSPQSSPFLVLRSYLQDALRPFEQAENLLCHDLLVLVNPRRLPGSCGTY